MIDLFLLFILLLNFLKATEFTVFVCMHIGIQISPFRGKKLWPSKVMLNN